jgi:hypothetical protein
MTETSAPTSPDEQAFRVDVSTGRFSAGVDASEWWLVGDITWPNAIIAISAGPRAGAPDEYYFRFELTGYPVTGGTAQVWNIEEERLATEAERPKVTYTPSPFRTDWLEGKALYIPCDRLAAPGHQWASDHAGSFWDPERGISKYLIYVHGRLNEDGYTGL